MTGSIYKILGIAILLVIIGLACGVTGGISQDDPEAVVRAYVDAILADDCEKAESLIAPDRRIEKSRRIQEECTNDFAYLVSASIDAVVVRDFDVNNKIVTLLGEFDYYINGKEDQEYDRIYHVENVEGKWYIKLP